MSACEAPGATSIRVALRLPFGKHEVTENEVAEYLLDPKVLPYWIGRRCELRPLESSQVKLPIWRSSDPDSDHFDEVRTGRVVESTWPSALVVQLDALTMDPPSPTPAAHPQSVELRLSQCADGVFCPSVGVISAQQSIPRERTSTLYLRGEPRLGCSSVWPF